MSISEITDTIQAKLEEDSDWGNSIFWGNLDSFQNDYLDEALPATCVHLEGSDMTESSTQNNYTVWSFVIRGVFWNDRKITTKPDFEQYETLNASLTTIYNNIISNLGCAWDSDPLRCDYESIDERFTITGRFSITVETIRN